MKIALVHDDFMQWGGAERLVKAFSDFWPGAPIYTSMHSDLSEDLKWLKDKDVHTSFMQRLPFKDKLYKFYFWLYPLAFRPMSFRGYDVVLSSSARFAHMIKVPKDTQHIAYINSPARMWWQPDVYFSSKIVRIVMSPVLSILRYLDRKAFGRIDFVIANSNNVAERIRKCFGREADAVIYPFVGDPSTPASSAGRSLGMTKGAGFYLVVSRLVPWKRIDIVIEACNQLRLPLTIIGQGEDKLRLQRLAGPSVRFLSGLTDDEVAGYYQRCVALIHPQEEDFGITPLEAMVFGKPVLAYGKGGVLETVLPGLTGEFFEEQTVASLRELLSRFDPKGYSFERCQQRAGEFGRENFRERLVQIVEDKN